MAGGRIKGITIEIGGDTTGLDKALRGVDKSLNTTQRSLKDVNKLLKLDPTNTKLLEQKQKLLTSAIEDTETKLSSLKEADKQAKKQLENGELGQDKYDALQREIIDTEIQLNNLKKQAKDIPNSFQRAGAKLSAIGGKMTEIGKGMSKNVTAPIVAVGVASIAAFNEVDAGMDIIVQKTGATGDALSEMEDIAKNMAKTIPTSFETAGTAVGEVNTRFGLTGTALDELSTKFVKFAELNGTDVSSSIDQVQKVLTAFGLSTEDAGAMLDTMNAVGQRTGVSMDSLASSMVTNSASLQQLGFSASDAANFLGNVEMSGADTTQVMSGLTKALATATENGKPMNEALAEMQNSMVNAKSETAGLQAAYDLFGKRAGAAIYQACKNGSLSFEELGTSMKDSFGSVDETYASTLDGTDALTTGMNSLKDAGAALGEAVGNTLAPMIESVSEKISVLTQWFSGLSPTVQQVIVIVGMIVAAIGPMLVVVGTLITSIGGLVTAFGALEVSILPIIAIVAAVIAAIIAIIAIIKNWGAITDWIKEKWIALKRWLASVMESIRTKVSEAFSNMVSRIRSALTEITSAVRNGFNGAISFITSLPSKAITWGKDFIEGLIQGIKSKIKGLVSSVKGIADKIASYLHFSRPDVGPLHYYEEWMPDFIDGLTKGIYSNIPKVAKAVAKVSDTISYGTMKDLKTTSLDPTQMYNAVRSGAQDASKAIILDGRRLDRQLKERGVVFAK